MQQSCIADFLRMAREGYGAPENFADFLRLRFGDTLYRLYFKPYNDKVWRRDLRQIPLSWLDGKLPMPTVAEILAANFSRAEERQFVHSSFFYPLSGGSQFIADRLAEGLDIRYNARVERLKILPTSCASVLVTPSIASISNPIIIKCGVATCA